MYSWKAENKVEKQMKSLALKLLGDRFRYGSDKLPVSH